LEYAIEKYNQKYPQKINNNSNSNKFNVFVSKLGNDFKNTVLKRGQKMGMDGALYFTLGEYETKLGMFNDLDNDEEQETMIDLIIQKFPELEI